MRRRKPLFLFVQAALVRKIHLGSTQISAIYLGSTTVTAVYLGSTLIHQA